MKGASFAWSTLGPEVPAVLVKYPQGYTQAKAGPFADFLGGKKRLEDPVHIAGRDAGTVVFDADSDAVLNPMGEYLDFTTTPGLGHGLLSIVQNI
jgi:hypothetical protein